MLSRKFPDKHCPRSTDVMMSTKPCEKRGILCARHQTNRIKFMINFSGVIV